MQGTGAQATAQFIEARDQLLRAHRKGPPPQFRWPSLAEFNWVRDYFDVMARANEAPALRVVDDAGADHSVSFSQMALRAAQVAGFLAAQGLKAGDRILIMLPNGTPLWESLLASIRLSAVIIPATTLLDGDDLTDRLERGDVKAVITDVSLTQRFPLKAPIRICVGGSPAGWTPYEASYAQAPPFPEAAATRGDDLLFLYFTSGTTSRPKLVAHTHASYPVGHLSTMYWLGLQPGDVHLNLSSPGWAKHAWSSFFAPWNAEATVLAYQYERFDPRALLNMMVRCRVTTFCAPPTVWRMLIQHDLAAWKVSLREVASAGEPLNPEVVSRVQTAWGLTIRDGFGQTETSAQIGNPPGQPLKPGSMGRPLPGFSIQLLTIDGQSADEGEICIDLAHRPTGLMQGYFDDPERTAAAFADGYYHTGDVGSRDADGYITYVGRMDDVFKCSDYRISPFELESVLIEHEAVVEAAVVPSPDALRLSVPKAFVTLAEGRAPDIDTAASILRYVRERVSPYKRIRRLEFSTLPKTISGKIRRADLRKQEASRPDHQHRRDHEFWEEDVMDSQSKAR